ncbi:MAG TPA: cyclase family protein, partial [Longimicrobium sp.]
MAGAGTRPRLVDLSHTVRDGTVTLRGFPAPVICDYLAREASRAAYGGQAEFHIGRIDMIANTGTYVDAPFHRYADGRDVSELPLEWVADLEGVVVRPGDAGDLGIGPAAFAGVEVAGKAVLVHTGHARHWGSDAYFERHPFLTRAAAEHLREAGAR